MDVVLNELSLDAQYVSDEAFFADLQVLLPLTTLLNKLDNVALLKSQDLWSCKVSTVKTLQDFLYVKGNPFLTKFKSDLLRLGMSPPYWETDRRHICVDDYTYQGKDICNSGLAEAVEREQLVLSFGHHNFSTDKLTVQKNSTNVSICNFHTLKGTLLSLLDQSRINEQTFCQYYFNGSNLDFSMLEESRGFTGLTTTERSLFMEQFKMFSIMSWEDITSSDGLQYKRYENILSGYESKDIYKFRVSQKYRCFGYRVRDVFCVVHFEVDHALSDRG